VLPTALVLGLARVIQELDRLVNTTAGVGTPAEVWKELRELRARAYLEFERVTGKSVDQVVSGKK
jgi:hypothetical protein